MISSHFTKLFKIYLAIAEWDITIQTELFTELFLLAMRNAI